MSSAAWDRPYPFDPHVGFPPSGARVHVDGLGDAVFREAGALPLAHWEVAGGIVRPDDDAGIQLAAAWARQNAVPTATRSGS